MGLWEVLGGLLKDASGSSHWERKQAPPHMPQETCPPSDLDEDLGIASLKTPFCRAGLRRSSWGRVPPSPRRIAPLYFLLLPGVCFPAPPPSSMLGKARPSLHGSSFSLHLPYRISYFAIAAMEHHAQGNLEKEEFCLGLLF